MLFTQTFLCALPPEKQRLADYALLSLAYRVMGYEGTPPLFKAAFRTYSL